MLLLQVQLGGHTATWGAHALGSVSAGPAPESTRFTVCDGHRSVFNISAEDLRPDMKVERGKQ